MAAYTANAHRYADSSFYRRSGNSGLLLPVVSIGCWHNFGGAGTDSGRHSDEAAFHENCRKMLFTAFDLGITHFDLANNYGPPPGSAEERVGRILKADFASYRDELIISSKAGYRMWDGPYGEWGSRKYLLASLDASLKRLQLDYVDIFYSHRFDPDTPLEETMAALDHAVKSGKALYAGISSYGGGQTAESVAICRQHDWTMPVIHQPIYSMLNRWIEPELIPVTSRVGMGIIAFSPLAQGMLTDKYLSGIPADSRAATGGFLKPEHVTEQKRQMLRKLNDVAKSRGQSLAQMALAWCLRHKAVTSVLIGASRPEQIVDNVKAAKSAPFSSEELEKIDLILRGNI